MKKKFLFSTILLIALVFLGVFMTGCDMADDHSCHSEDWIIDRQATCTQLGLKHKKCDECGKVFDAIDIQMLPHNYDEPQYIWSADNSICVAKHNCKVCSHLEEETGKTAKTVTQNRDCTNDEISNFTVSFTLEGFETQTKNDVVSANKLNHDYSGDIVYIWYDNNSKCKAGKICKNDSNHFEGEEGTVTTSVVEKCEQRKVTTYIATFSNSLYKKQTKLVTAEKITEHNYGEPTYTWSSDNTTCHAEVLCLRCNSQVQEDANSTNKVVTEKTCHNVEETLYTATFENSLFKTQTKTVEGTTYLSHEYEGDFENGFVCKNCEFAPVAVTTNSKRSFADYINTAGELVFAENSIHSIGFHHFESELEIILYKDIEIYNTLGFSGRCILNLNGHTIKLLDDGVANRSNNKYVITCDSFYGPYYSSLQNAPYLSLTVKNGYLISKENSGGISCNSTVYPNYVIQCQLTLQNVGITCIGKDNLYNAINMTQMSSDTVPVLTINNDDEHIISAENETTILVQSQIKVSKNTAKVTINGGIIKSTHENAIVVDVRDVNIYLNAGKIIGTSPNSIGFCNRQIAYAKTFYWNFFVEENMEITAGTCIYTYAGFHNIMINGGTFNATGVIENHNDCLTSYGYGVTGDAIVINNSSRSSSAKLMTTINGGVFNITDPNAHYLHIYKSCSESILEKVTIRNFDSFNISESNANN